VDLEKAYDSLPHPAISLTLKYYGASPEVLNLIKNYTKTHKPPCAQDTETQNRSPSTKESNNGDPLSPLLWNLFINPVVEQLLTADSAYTTTHGEKIGNTMFMDNITILSSSAQNLVSSFTLFQGFCDYHHLQISPS